MASTVVRQRLVRDLLTESANYQAGIAFLETLAPDTPVITYEGPAILDHLPADPGYYVITDVPPAEVEVIRERFPGGVDYSTELNMLVIRQ